MIGDSAAMVARDCQTIIAARLLKPLFNLQSSQVNERQFALVGQSEAVMIAKQDKILARRIRKDCEELLVIGPLANR